MGLHPSQTDFALTVLMQRAHVGDPTAQRIMAHHWGQQAAMSTGNFSPAASMDGVRPPPPPRVDLSRVTIAGINMDTAELAQNSLYTFRNACARLGVPMSGGDSQQDQHLSQLVELWCEKSSKVVTSLRNTFPGGGCGYDKLRHVEQVFISPKVLARDKNPEDAVAAFSFNQMYRGSGLDFHDKAQQLRELTARLPASVRGDDRYWIERTRNAAGITVSFYYDRVLPEMIEQDDDVTQAEVKSNWTIFVRVMAAALDRSRRDAQTESTGQLQTFTHPRGNDREQPQPSTCQKNCPSHSGGECDVQGKPTAARLAELNSHPGRKKWVNKERQRLSLPKLNYPQLTADQKAAQEEYDAAKPQGKGSGREGPLAGGVAVGSQLGQTFTPAPPMRSRLRSRRPPAGKVGWPTFAIWPTS